MAENETKKYASLENLQTFKTNADNLYATKVALDGKSDTGHGHTVSEISDLTATAAELNYMSGVTSEVQTQIDDKQAQIDGKMNSVNPVGSGSFSFGRKADTTVGVNSVAIGSDVEASGNYSHAEGYYATASGNYSHAEGTKTTASGNYSHAEGSHTLASGDSSHAEGEATTASGDYSHVQGLSNIEDTEKKYLHIVGNGTRTIIPPSSENGWKPIITYTSSNAHTLDWEGNAWFAGDVYVGSTSGTNKDEGSVKLVSETDLTTALDSVGSKNTWYGTCPTAAATTAKVVTTSSGDFKLETGNVVYVKFTYQAVASATLNVDGTGAIAIKTVGTNNVANYYWSPNEAIGFVYDGEYFRMIDSQVATTTYYGMTKLSSSTSSNATNVAATPSAVKAAYDLANAANTAVNNTETWTFTLEDGSTVTKNVVVG